MEHVTVFAILQSAADRRSLANIFDHSRWELRFAEDVTTCERGIRDGLTGVVISDCVLADGTGWKDVLFVIESQPSPPALIVAEAKADERLWAEVLNLGCYDLLLKPFDAREAFRVISSAWLSWKHKRQNSLRSVHSVSAAVR